MARFNNSTTSTEKSNSYQQSVLVTHVESPVLFYCRLLEEHQEQFSRLQAAIDLQIEAGGGGGNSSGAALQTLMPNIHSGNHRDHLVLLVYSTIRDRWCRGRLLSYQANSQDGTPINAKVHLIDYGSVEIVLWNGKYVRPSTGEIDAFNDGAGFCFPCSLANLEPTVEEEVVGGGGKLFNSLQWSSYANFLIEKETKNRAFLLEPEAEPEPTTNHHRHQFGPTTTTTTTILTCDLLPLSELELLSENNSFFSTFSHNNGNHHNHRQQSNFTSLSALLVEANVARYVGGGCGVGGPEVPEESSGNFEGDDDEKENNRVFIATNC